MLRTLYENKHFIVGFDLFLRGIISRADVDLGDEASIFLKPAYSYNLTHFAFAKVMS